MNLNPPINLYNAHYKFLADISETVCKKFMSLAVTDAVAANDGCTDPHDNDGSWQKNGHTSLNGRKLYVYSYCQSFVTVVVSS